MVAARVVIDQSPRTVVNLACTLKSPEKDSANDSQGGWLVSRDNNMRHGPSMSEVLASWQLARWALGANARHRAPAVKKQLSLQASPIQILQAPKQ